MASSARIGLTEDVGQTTEPLDLGADFPSVDRDDWLAGVRKVLTRNHPDATDDEVAALFAKQLVTRTEDGFDLQPLYTAADAPDPRTPPGAFPYVRGTHHDPRDWEIRQRVWPDVDGSDAVTELEQGATGVLVEVGGDATSSDLDRILDGVLLDLAPVSLSTPASSNGVEAARSLMAVWETRSIEPGARRGSLGVDPIGAWARSGGSTALDTDTIAELVDELAESAPNARALVADGTVWHDAGATDGQELAWTIAAAVEMVRRLAAAGVDTERAFASIEFRLAATADQFATICKLRAARALWSRIGELSGVAPERCAMFVHADASRPMLTRYDPWVNSLRSTVACFAAALGDADAITITPHDALIEPGGSALGRRLARNTQSVLLLESNLARVTDIAGGSWYVERRTDQLADVAWAELQRVEGVGGLVAAVENGSVHEAIAVVTAQRSQAVATRKRPLTGLTEFPNIAETPPPVTDPTARPTSGAGTPFEPFTLRRLSDDFERLRARADAVASGGERPTLFLAALGGPAASTARATFAKNFFEVAGIHTIEGDVADFDPSVTTFACLCSSDPVYEAQGTDAVRALRDSGATTIYVAGRGVDLEGVDGEIGLGVDLLDTLGRTLDQMGVPS